MSKLFAISGVLFIILSVVLTSVGIAAADWFKICIPYSRFSDFAYNFFGSSDNDLPIQLVQIFRGRDSCIKLGLFQIVFDAGIITSSFSLSVGARENFIAITVAVLIAGIVLLGFGLIPMILGTTSSSFKVNKLTSSRLFQVGVLVLVFGALSLLAGMLLYTIKQREVRNNPALFSSHLQLISPSVAAQLRSGQNLELPIINVGLPIDFESMDPFKHFESKTTNISDLVQEFLDSSYVSGSGFNFDSEAFDRLFAINSDNTTSSPSNNIVTRPLSISNTLQFFSDTSFAYAFFLGWAGVICAFIACMFGGLSACFSLRKTNVYTNSILK